MARDAIHTLEQAAAHLFAMISMVSKEKAFKRNFSARTLETSQKGTCNGILRFSLEQCGVTHNINPHGYCEFHKYQHDRKLNPAPTYVQVSIEEARRAHAAKSKPKPAKEVKVPEVKAKEPKRAKDTKGEARRVKDVPKATKQSEIDGTKAVKEAREIEVNGANKQSMKQAKLPAVGEVANLAKGGEREIKVTKRKESSKAAEEANRFKEDRERVLKLASEEKAKRANEIKQAALAPKPVEEKIVKEVKEIEKVIEKEMGAKEELGAKVAIEDKPKLEPISTEPANPAKAKRTNGAKSGVDDSEKNYEPFYWDSPNTDSAAEGPVWDGELEKVEWIEEPKLAASFVHHGTSEREEASKKDNYDDFFENEKSSVRNGNSREENLNDMRLSRPDNLQFGHVTEKNKQVTQYIFRFEDLPSISASASEKQQQQKTKGASDPFTVEWEY